jgi:hypothetical protein
VDPAVQRVFYAGRSITWGSGEGRVGWRWNEFLGPKLHSPIGSCNFTGAHKTRDIQRQPPLPEIRLQKIKIKELQHRSKTLDPDPH